MKLILDSDPQGVCCLWADVRGDGVTIGLTMPRVTFMSTNLVDRVLADLTWEQWERVTAARRAA